MKTIKRLFFFSIIIFTLATCRKSDFDSGADGMKITITVDNQSKSYIWPNGACFNSKDFSWDDNLPTESLDFQNANTFGSVNYLNINFRPSIQVLSYNLIGLESSNYTSDWPSQNDIQMTLGTYFDSPFLPTNFSTGGVWLFYPKNGTINVTSKTSDKISFNVNSNWSERDNNDVLHNITLKIEARNIRLQ